jgi:hypothetical protein
VGEVAQHQLRHKQDSDQDRERGRRCGAVDEHVIGEAAER